MSDMHEALREAVRKVHPKHKAHPERALQHELLSGPEPCEVCGTIVVAFRTSGGTPRVYQIGPLVKHGPDESAVRFQAHQPRCVRPAVSP